MGDKDTVKLHAGKGELTPKMASDVITLCTGGDTVFPFASETEVIGALPAYVIIT